MAPLTSLNTIESVCKKDGCSEKAVYSTTTSIDSNGLDEASHPCYRIMQLKMRDLRVQPVIFSLEKGPGVQI